MINNYRDILIKKYNQFHVSSIEANKYHEEGLKYFLGQINAAKQKNIVDGDFIEFMQNSDSNWDKLMTNFIPKGNLNTIDSREIEFSAGSYKNCLYPDAKSFLTTCVFQLEEIDFYICSNAHTEHVKGILNGAGFSQYLKENQYIGWNTTKSFKNNLYYFQQLKNFSKHPLKILIGNSDDEINYAKKLDFKTILVLREYSEKSGSNINADIEVMNLNSIFDAISSLI